MGKRTSLTVIVLGATAAGALIASARMPPAMERSEIDQIAAEMDASLREAAAATRSRAQTLADLPRLAVAVATDALTVRDLTDEELAFRPRPGETIEIAQVPVGGGPPMSLLRIPFEEMVAVPLDKPGVHLILAGTTLRVAAVVRVEPRERADELFGTVAVSRPPDLGPVMKLVSRLGGGVRLEVDAGAIAIGGALSAPHGTVEVALASETGQGARLIVPAPAPGGWSVPRLAIGFGVVVVALIAAVLLRPRGAAPAPALAPSLPTVAQFAAGPRPDLPESFRIGRYTVLRKLGSGGMADVYLARSEGEAGFERLVALKLIQDEMVSNPKFVNHFLDEARLASQLVHPNIVAITDLGREDDKYVIAMEYVDGADLERLIKSAVARLAPVPVRVGLGIVRRICDGLHFAHTAVDAQGQPLHLVHRDVKSANVFVARSGAVKVGDFGIARIAGPTRMAKTEIGEVKGTPAYRAPEHRLGQVELDLRADLYAVGAICYELLTGRAVNLDLAMLAHLGKEGWPHLEPPSRVRAEVPAELDPVIFKAMAFDREQRYPTCEALELALGEIVERHGLSASDKVIAQWVVDELGVLPRAATAPGQALRPGAS